MLTCPRCGSRSISDWQCWNCGYDIPSSVCVASDGVASKEANNSPLGAIAERTAQSIEALPEGRSPQPPKGLAGVWGEAPRFTGHRDATSMTRQGQPEGPSNSFTVAQSSGIAKRRDSVAMAGGLGACPQGSQVEAA